MKGNYYYFESMFYDENGNFKPLTGRIGTLDENKSLLRDTYMEAEKKYFLSLLSNEKTCRMFLDYTEQYADDLFSAAEKVMEKMESGQLETEEELEAMKKMSLEDADALHFRVLERYEAVLTLLLAAARDRVRVKYLALYRTDKSKNNNKSKVQYLEEEQELREEQEFSKGGRSR